MSHKLIFLAVFLLLFAGDSKANDADESSIQTAPNLTHYYSAPLILINNRIFTNVSVNSTGERLFMIDNGCRFSHVDGSFAKNLYSKDVGTVRFGAIDKKNWDSRSSIFPKLTVGNLDVHSPVLKISDFPGTLTRLLRRNIYGVLGNDFMCHYLTAFDLKNNRVLFFPDPEGTRELFRSLPGAAELPFGSHTFSKHSIHLFSIKIDVNGRYIDAVVDMGYAGAILTTVDPRKLGLSVSDSNKRISVSVGGYKGVGYVLKRLPLQFGNGQVFRASVVYFDNDEAPKFTLVGVDVLRQFVVAFDYEDGALFLVPNESVDSLVDIIESYGPQPTHMAEGPVENRLIKNP
jgi:hypothetical protein